MKLRHLLLRRKVMTNLDSILKSRNITLPIKVRLVKTMVFPVVMYGCESWTVKKAEGWRIDAFELWCWRRLLRVPWTARRSNQSILKEVSPGFHWKDWSWSWNSNTLATLCDELTHWKRPWCWEGLGAGGEGADRMRWLDGITDLMDMSLSKLRELWWTGRPGMLWFMGLQRVRHDWVTELTYIYKHNTVSIYMYVYVYTQTHTHTWGFPGGSVVKNLPGFNPWVKKIPWRRKWQPLQYSYLGNPLDRGAWQVIIHGVAKSLTWLKWP